LVIVCIPFGINEGFSGTKKAPETGALLKKRGICGTGTGNNGAALVRSTRLQGCFFIKNGIVLSRPFSKPHRL
jgi:hypothetical protein